MPVIAFSLRHVPWMLMVGTVLGLDQAEAQNPTRGASVMGGERILGIDVGTAEDEDWDAAVEHVKAAGAEDVSLSLNWDDIEVAPWVYDNPYLRIANDYYPLHGLSVSLTIGPIDTNRNRMPADLAHLPLDHPVVLERFKGLLGFVAAETPDLDISCFSIGNEVDIYCGVDSSLWSAYETLFITSRDHFGLLRPGIPLGVKTTFSGMVGAQRPFVQSLQAHTDIVFFSYYPLNSDFSVRRPDVVSGDWRRLVSLYPQRVLYAMEVGYPSGSLVGSSEELQARFVQAVFRAWDHEAASVRMIHFNWLTDIPPESVDDYRDYYGIDDPLFLDYLATLGLRTYPGLGSDKLAMIALKEEAEARGF